MAGVPVAGADAGTGRDPLLVVEGLAQLQRRSGIFHGVERLGRLLAAAAQLLGLLLRLALLDARGIGKEELEEAGGRWRAPDGLAIAIGGELGQQAGVIDMRVREQQEVDGPGVEGQRLEVEVADGSIALEQASIDEELTGRMDHAVAGAGHGAGRAVEMDGHGHCGLVDFR